MRLEATLLVEALYALGIGLLIGLERSTVRDPAPRERETVPSPEETAFFGEELGLRTFATLSLAGLTAAFAADRWPFVLPLVLGGLFLLIVSRYWRANQLGVGITTEAAAVVACALGVLCHGDKELATVLGLLLTVILALKRFTKELVSSLRRVEVTDTLKFLVIILILLPLLPDRTLDPHGVFNPYKVGLLVVLISGISFIGYFLTRLLGPRHGLGLMGILGGLTSSTAVTAAMAAEARRRPELLGICAFSTLAANATMFARVLVVVALLSWQLFTRLVYPLGAMALATAICAVVFYFKTRVIQAETTSEAPRSAEIRNPFAIKPALAFGAFFVLVLFVARFARLWFGEAGLLAAAAFAGFADVDAITLSLAEQVQKGLQDVGSASLAITVAVVMNGVVKTSMAFFSGGKRFGVAVGIGLGIATLLGLAVALVVA